MRRDIATTETFKKEDETRVYPKVTFFILKPSRVHKIWIIQNVSFMTRIQNTFKLMTPQRHTCSPQAEASV